MLASTAMDAVDAAPQETTASMRARRQVLIQRIAALTDEAARARARADDAQHRLLLTNIALAHARDTVARYAVDAYIDGVQDAEDKQLRRKAWATALASTDMRVLGEFRAARDAAEKQRASARAVLAESRQLTAELDAARAALERTIADRLRIERAAEKASRRAVSRAVSTGVPRHRRATMSQADLMRTYQFGPATGVPAGLVATGEVLEGRASWYGPGFDGRPTASGAIFDQEGWTVAHRTLPLGTILLISHGGRSVVALVNDRGPFVSGRILDLSHGVAAYLGTVHAGVAPVRAEILVPG